MIFCRSHRRSFRLRWPRCTWALLLLHTVTATGTTTEESAEGVFAPRHVAKQRLVISVAASPDGEQIAYTLAVPRKPLEDDDGPSWVELHVVDRNGTSRPFITGKVNIGTPQWIPDGSALLYTAKRHDDQTTALYRIPFGGGESQRIVTHGEGIGDFAISPDGKRIAFLAAEAIPAEAKQLRDKGFNQEIYEEDARPTKVWITGIDGSPAPEALELKGSASLVEWSPSGRELVVVLAPTSLIDDSFMAKTVHVVDVDAGRSIAQVDHRGKLGQVSWNPDGTRLAMVAAADIHDPQEGRLKVVSVSGEEPPRDLMPDFEAHVTSFAWRDAETLVWLADEGTKTRVGTVTLAGDRKTLVEPGGVVLSSLSQADNAPVLGLTGQSAAHPDEAFVVSLEENSGEPKRLTDVNPWLTALRLARQEVVTWTARDGLELQGVLIYPLNYVEGRRYPLIVSVHGGPEAHEPDGWMTSYARPGQAAAARGFAVFYPNYRGSTGRGVEFSKMGQADAAGKEFDDLIDGIDHLIEQGLVDRERVGITGGSYGGYASAWGATYYSDRFAASVMFVGISDNISKLGTTDIPEEMYLVHHRKRLWEDWDYFLERSPIRYLERNRTPTLILHGKQDPRVHPSQSLELYRHLKTLNQAPVRLVLYEGEGHGNRKAAARLDYHLRLLRWMEHYLQGPGGDAPPLHLDYEKSLKRDP